MADKVKLTKAERATLERLATGDSIVFSQDGDNAWFSGGDRSFVGDEVISLRIKGLTERVVDDEENYRGMSESDVITPLGLSLIGGGE